MIKTQITGHKSVSAHGKSYNFPWFLHVRVNSVNAKLQRRARAGSRIGAGGRTDKGRGRYKAGRRRTEERETGGG